MRRSLDKYKNEIEEMRKNETVLNEKLDSLSRKTTDYENMLV